MAFHQETAGDAKTGCAQVSMPWYEGTSAVAFIEPKSAHVDWDSSAWAYERITLKAALRDAKRRAHQWERRCTMVEAAAAEQVEPKPAIHISATILQSALCQRSI